MIMFLSVCCGALLIIIIFLTIKLLSVHRGITDISWCITEKLQQETNTLITVSSNDCYIRSLAVVLNKQLKELRIQHRRYVQGDKELKDAVTYIAHDLRTPLTAIKGYLDLAKNEEKNAKLAEYLKVVEERIAVMNQLTEELFRYSIITSTDSLSFEHVDIKRLLEECVLSFYGVLSQRGIEPQIEIESDEVICYLDVQAARRVINNIISNCVKYSDGDFCVRLLRNGSITFSNKASNLDNVKVGRLFDRFYTVESNSQSTGLGLSIAKTLTERMHGTIGADYSSGRLSIMVSFPTRE